jgi:hypothetical protein
MVIHFNNRYRKLPHQRICLRSAHMNVHHCCAELTPRKFIFVITVIDGFGSMTSTIYCPFNAISATYRQKDEHFDHQVYVNKEAQPTC